MQNRTLDEASVTSMIQGFLSTQKENMLKRNKSGAKKKLQKFWSNINESVSLLEARDVMAMHPQTNQFEPATVIGATPSSSGTVFKVQWKDESLGEPTVLPGNKIQFERAATGGPEEDVFVRDETGIGDKKASLIGEIPTKNGRMARVIIREPGSSLEPVLVPMSRVTRAGQNKWAPKQKMSIGAAHKAKEGPKLHDEVDPQAGQIADKMTEKLPTTSDELKQMQAQLEPEDKGSNALPVKNSKAGGSMKQAITGDQLRRLTNEKLVDLIGGDPEFSARWRALKERSQSSNEEEASAAKKEIKSIKVSIANKIYDQYGATSKLATEDKLAAKKGGDSAAKQRFLFTISKKFLDAVAPDIAAGKIPKPELIVMGKSMFDIEFRKPLDVAKIMKILRGEPKASDEAVSEFVKEFASKSEDATAFASARLDTFPGNFVDKIERIANKENIPSQYERQQKGEFGGIGQGTKKISVPKKNDPRPGQELKASQKLQNTLAAKSDPEKLKDIEGTVYSRSKVGNTPVARAAQELPIDEIAKLFNYFSQNKDEVARATAERRNKSDVFSKGKLPTPGGTGDFDEESMLGSKSGAKIKKNGTVAVPSVLSKFEQKKLQDEAEAEKSKFKKSIEKRFASQIFQDEDEAPVESGPALSPDPKNIPEPKDLWGRIVNVNVDNNPFAKKLISAAAKAFNADEEDVEAVLKLLLKTNKKGLVTDLLDPRKERPAFERDESGAILHPEDVALSLKLFNALNPGRLQTKKDGKTTEAEQQLAPAFEEFGRGEAEKAINLPSLNQHIATIQAQEEEDKAAKEKELADLKNKRMSPEQIEKINYELDMARAKVGAAIKARLASYKDEDGNLKPETVRRFAPLVGFMNKNPEKQEDIVENYKFWLSQLEGFKPLEIKLRDSNNPKDEKIYNELEAFREKVSALHGVIPKDPYVSQGTVRTTPHSSRGIDNPTGKLVRPKQAKSDFEKQARDKEFLGMKTTYGRQVDPEQSDPEKALANYSPSPAGGRYGNPGTPRAEYSKESAVEVRNRRLSNILSAAKKHVAKQKVPLTVSSVVRSMKRIIEKNDKYKDLAGVDINKELIKKLDGMHFKSDQPKKDVSMFRGALAGQEKIEPRITHKFPGSAKKEKTNPFNNKQNKKKREGVKESMQMAHKLSLFEFLTIPGKKTLSHAETKEKDWDKSNPVRKQKFAPKFDKQKKPSASKKKGC